MTETKLARLPEALFEIGKAIGSDRDLGSLLAHIAERVTELVGAEACSIMLLDRSGGRLVGRAAFGLARRKVSALRFRVGEGVAGWVVERGEPALIDDVTLDPRYLDLPDSSKHIRSMACVPLLSVRGPVGVLTTTSPRLAAFRRSDLNLLAFVARTIALDIENKRLRRLSVTDSLTGTYNREFLQRELPQQIEAAGSLGQPLSVAMVDVDHFKRVNDRFGHEIGDRVLARVARRLRRAIRDDDLLVRYGGEEFLALLPRSDCDKAREIGERMRLRLEREPIGIGDAELDVRISVGVAEYRRSDSAVELIRRADAGLYRAKDLGRNRVEVAT